MRAALTLLDDHLAGREFIVGENLTLADISIFNSLIDVVEHPKLIGDAVPVFDPSEYKNVLAFVERMKTNKDLGKFYKEFTQDGVKFWALF